MALSGTFAFLTYSFNRTIVELKLDSISFCAVTSASFNRTIVELKSCTSVLALLSLLAFNRTIVELKCNRKCY